MNEHLYFHLCEYCGKYTPINNFCVYCGNEISTTEKCTNCNSLIPNQARYCPFCGQFKFQVSEKYTKQAKMPQKSYLRQFRVSILVIFLLSIYSLTQFLVGSILIIFFPDTLTVETTEAGLYSISTMLISTILMIYFTSKILSIPSFYYSKEIYAQNQKPHVISIAIIILITISMIEILLNLLDMFLNFLSFDTSQVSPYDTFFLSPINIVLFTILAVLVGPILEELIFRRLIIVILLAHSKSKAFIIVISALIFGISHLPADILEGTLRYAILHLAATFIIGIILGMVFLKWGLKYSIAIHSLWNIFSLIAQLLANYDYIDFLDLIILFSFILSVISIIILLLTRKSQIISSLTYISFPSKSETSFISLNFGIILLYELFLPLLLVLIGSTLIITMLIVACQIFGAVLGYFFVEREKKMNNLS